MKVFARVLVVSLLASACNRTPPEPPAVSASAEATSPSTVVTAPTPSRDQAGAQTRPPPSMSAPTVEVPSGPPPTTLQTTDLVVGTGAEARAGARVDVQYTGVAWSTHRQFDSSWTRGAHPFTFTLGQHMVIPGWDQGVAGMKVGGRRRLVIPPDLGYGARGAGADIGPNETLVFVVDLVAIH